MTDTTTTETVLNFDEYTVTVTPAQDGVLETTTFDMPNGLWTITDLEDGDFDVEGPTHHFEGITFEGRENAEAYVLDNGVDRRRAQVSHTLTLVTA